MSSAALRSTQRSLFMIIRSEVTSLRAPAVSAEVKSPKSMVSMATTGVPLHHRTTAVAFTRPPPGALFHSLNEAVRLCSGRELAWLGKLSSSVSIDAGAFVKQGQPYRRAACG